MYATSRTRLLAAVAAAITPVIATRAMVADSGNFLSEIVRLKNLSFTEDSGLYLTPSTSQVNAFKSLANTLLAGNVALADTQASALNYDLVSFTDTATSRTYYELREKLAAGQQVLGWGTYVLNPSYAVDAIVEVPHPLADGNTENIGARAFQLADARFFTMAGAHRNANGEGTADMTHLSDTIFQAVHEAWNGASAQSTAWQIHGFATANHSEFPADTNAVLSDGSNGGTVTGRILTLDAQFAAHGLNAYAYNSLSPANPTNVQVNSSPSAPGTVYAGSTFSPLGAETNVQGDYSRLHGGAFVHVEMSEAIRNNSANREAAATSIALAMSNSAVSEKLWDGQGGTSWTAPSNAGTSWSPDGVPSAADAIVFDNSLVPTLPSTMVLFRSTGLPIKYLVWNSNDSSSIAGASSSTAPNPIILNGDGIGGTTPLISMGALATSSTLTFSGTGGTTDTNGPILLQLAASGAFNVSGAGANLSIAAQITEAGGPRTIEKTGAGTLTLTNSSNAFTGGVVISEGTLSTGNFGTLGPTPTGGPKPDSIVLNGGTFRWTASSPTTSVSPNRGLTLTAGGGTVEIANPAAVVTFNGPISGSGTLTKSGPGEFVLSNSTNTANFNGPIVITGGTLTAASTTSLPAIPVPAATQITLAGGTFRWNGLSTVNFSANRGIALAASGGALDIANASATFTFNGTITGPDAATLTKNGAGILVLGGSNTFGNGVVVNGGTLSISQGTNLGDLPPSPATDLTLNNGSTLRVTSGFTLGSTRGVLLGDGGATFDVTADAPFSIAGVVSGTGSLTKTGPGTLILDQGNTYTGPTTILAGTLSTEAASSVGTGGDGDPLPLTIANHATLQVTSSYTTARPIAIGPGGATIDVTDGSAYSRTAPITGADTLTKTGAGLMVVPNLRSHPLDLAAGQVTVASNGTDAGTSLLTALSISPGATLDLTDNKLIVDFASTTDVTAGLTQIRQYLAASQLLSSPANADPRHRLALAYVDNSLLNLPSFGGLDTDATSILLMTTYLGDANLDGRLDPDDYALLDRSYAKSLPNPHWSDGDFNYDGQITPADYLLLDTAYLQQQGGTPSPTFLSQRESQFGADYVSALLTTIPEPSLLPACGLALLPLTRRRQPRT